MSDLIEVHLRELPLAEQQQAAQHFDELLREFSMLRAADGSGRGVPARLIELREDIGRRFERFAANARATVDAARREGASSVEVTYRVPVDAVEAAAQLSALLDEADEFCRSGADLLTLATPEPALRYRRWFLREFARQAAGEAPCPWPEYQDEVPAH